MVAGGRPIHGSVRVGPAKNALLPELAAALLTEDEVQLSPVTHMRDVDAMTDLLTAVGAAVAWSADQGVSSVSVRAAGGWTPDPPADVVGQMRASVLVLGPLLARCGRLRLATPGGCAIGDRPIDLHLRAMSALGADVREGTDFVDVRAPRGLTGGHVHLPFPSHTATENAMLAAVLARGETIVSGAAREPEIVDLAALLCGMGADVTGAGTPVVRIRGQERLHGARYRPIADRIEAGTYLLAAAVTGGAVRVEGVMGKHLDAVVRKLTASGFAIEQLADSVCLAPGCGPIRAVDIRTQPYPGFPTDLQPQFCVLSAISRGGSLIHETVFNRRLSHLRDLMRMGAMVTPYGRRFAWIEGPAKLRGRRVTAADLRGGAALVLAGMAAEGQTVVEAAEHVARGYADLAGTLGALGVIIHAEGGVAPFDLLPSPLPLPPVGAPRP